VSLYIDSGCALVLDRSPRYHPGHGPQEQSRRRLFLRVPRHLVPEIPASRAGGRCGRTSQDDLLPRGPTQAPPGPTHRVPAQARLEASGQGGPKGRRRPPEARRPAAGLPAPARHQDRRPVRRGVRRGPVALRPCENQAGQEFRRRGLRRVLQAVEVQMPPGPQALHRGRSLLPSVQDVQRVRCAQRSPHALGSGAGLRSWGASWEGFPRRVHHPGRRTRDARRRTSRGAETLREAVSDPACRAVVGEPRIPRL
jgi:hypothetical protein